MQLSIISSGLRGECAMLQHMPVICFHFKRYMHAIKCDFPGNIFENTDQWISVDEIDTVWGKSYLWSNFLFRWYLCHFYDDIHIRLKAQES